MCISVCTPFFYKITQTGAITSYSGNERTLRERRKPYKLTTVKKGRSQRFIRTFKVVVHVVLPSFYIFYILSLCGCGNIFLSISMIARQTCLIFQEYIRGLRDELIGKKTGPV